MDDRGTSPPALRSSRLRDEVLTYLSGNLSDQEAKALASLSRGVVVKGKQGLRLARVLRREGCTGLVVHDPATYEKQTGIPETEQLSLLEENETLAHQRNARVDAFLSPSGYVPAGDVETLAAVLTAGVLYCEAAAEADATVPSFAVLPIARAWLVDRRSRAVLVRTARAADVPVALIPCDRNDPLGTYAAVDGLVEVVTSIDNVLVLRSDLSAIGAVAWGALAGSIGTGTAVRHAVPPGQRGGGAQGDDSPAVLLRTTDSFVKGSYLDRMRLDLDCGCRECGGNNVRRFADARLREEAHRHNLHCWNDLVESILTLPSDRRAAAWTVECQRAIEAISELRSRTKVPINVPPALRAWARQG